VIDFFLRRPIFATVCSLVILLVGVISIPLLPIAQYPNISPPTVTVQALYTGASAEAVESSVTTPLEEAINGIQGLRYISSQSSSDGSMQITAVFNLDRNLDQAANDVQNAVNLAQGRLPNEVKLTGVQVSKNNGTFVMAIGVTSKNARYDQVYLTNFLETNVVNDLKRIGGVSDVFVFGERKFAMRLWVDPKRLADNSLTAGDVTTALQEQNIQVAAGAIGSPPTNGNQPYEYPVHANGRLRDSTEFANIVLRTNPDGGIVRVRDVGRVSLGAESYSGSLWVNGAEGVGLGILQLSTGNALQVSKQVRAALGRLSQKFPPGVGYTIAFDSTDFVAESIKEVVITLLIAVALVVLVIFLFLQDWRTTLIPAITIPISLLGTFFLMKALGFSINTLTLFGLTLATGLVVDDAIVVIENIARFIQEKKMSPFEGARQAMHEIFGAVMASSLVLLAVFVPVAFFPGTTGQLYKQFALTIACSISISFFVAITLTPVLSSIFLGNVERRRTSWFWSRINAGIGAIRSAYHGSLPRTLRHPVLGVITLCVLLAATAFLFVKAPTGFIPDEDQGYFVIIGQGPEGVSLDYTHSVQRDIEKILRQQPEIEDIFDVGGFSFTGNASNKLTMFVKLRTWAERHGAQHSLDAVIGRVNRGLFMYPRAQTFAVNPPAIPGLGFQGGFDFELEDRTNAGIPALLAGAYQIIGPTYAPGSSVTRAYTTFNNNSPGISIDVDRNKVKSLNVNLANLFATLQVYLGSVYVNDFNMGSKSYRVYVQADTPYRSRIADLDRFYVRGTPAAGVDLATLPSGAAGQIPLTSLVDLTRTKSPPVITHYNLYRAIDINGAPAPGHGSGDAISTMQRLAANVGNGLTYEWTGTALEEIEGGSQAALIFGLGIVFVFLVLAAQYESFAEPLIILLAVPLALLGAIIGLKLHAFLALVTAHGFLAAFPLFFALLPSLFTTGGYVSDVFAQVGYVMLIGLASKNAILIVEFANQLRAQGVPLVDAARQAAETRLRPILMTSIAFVLGVTPLVFATGAGSAARNSLGTVVFGGMIFSTALNLFITPVLYVVIAGLEQRFRPRHGPGPNGHAELEPARLETERASV
jgi:HAE1 family hydrophobic/amphiphilic exporter-1